MFIIFFVCINTNFSGVRAVLSTGRYGSMNSDNAGKTNTFFGNKPDGNMYIFFPDNSDICVCFMTHTSHNTITAAEYRSQLFVFLINCDFIWNICSLLVSVEDVYIIPMMRLHDLLFDQSVHASARLSLKRCLHSHFCFGLCSLL